VHSPLTTLDLVARQKSLNFPPGSQHLYSNTGYALAALIVERASGTSLQEFSQARLFRPLGMTHTQWRDDFTRVVRNRATAYAPAAGGFRQKMPFTNMVGNGGLLSTMRDLLLWNENLDRPTVGGPAFTQTMEAGMRLTNGRTIPYALGLVNGTHDGVREVAHGGATAGYRTYLARYPDQHVSVAVWCSNAGVNATMLARQVADLVLVKPERAATAARPAAAPAARLTPAELARWAGWYRDPYTDQSLMLAANDSALIAGSGATFVPVAPDRFRTTMGEVLFSRTGGRRTLTLVRAGGDTTRFEETGAPATPLPAADYAGRYTSDELEVSLTVLVKDGKLWLRRRLGEEIELRPTYADAFQASGVGSVRFARDAKGAVTGFGIFAGRVLDVRFRRVK